LPLYERLMQSQACVFTGFRETHKIQWKNQGADVYTLSDLMKAEPATRARFGNFTKQNWDMPIFKSHTSSRPPLFLPAGGR
jgi:hypothetical protein